MQFAHTCDAKIVMFGSTHLHRCCHKMQFSVDSETKADDHESYREVTNMMIECFAFIKKKK